MREIYRVPSDLQRRIDEGTVEDWEYPFVCDECGDFKQGGELSNKSNGERCVCMSCMSLEEMFGSVTNKKVSIIMDGATV